MELFKGKQPNRDIMADMFNGPIDYSELERLRILLDKFGIEYEQGGSGPFKGVVFVGSHGRVSCVIGPGSMGCRDGLLESYCEGWDLSPRGNMTAREIVEEYRYGGW